MKRKTRAILLSLASLFFVWAMGKSWGPLPPLGPFFHPSLGFWAQAVPVESDLGFQSRFIGLKRPVQIDFDQRKIPHIRAGNLEDAYFSQGYLHACFRLWQMDMQTRAAQGRLSEVLGIKTVEFDRKQRRKGMVYGAEKSLDAIMADSLSKTILEAYTKGVNAFIHSLHYRQYPLEYKLMDFQPEPWTPLKTALLLMYMADELSGESQDLLLTHLSAHFPDSLLDLAYGFPSDHAIPFIPSSTPFPPAQNAHSLPSPRSSFPSSLPMGFPIDWEGKGSNAWVIHGSRTANGHVLLANDPHLQLGLPSLWFEMQIQSPEVNCYGVSLPGAPGIIIGFNDHIAWGLTNNYQDVKDYYLLDVDTSEKKYAFGDTWIEFQPRPEMIAVKGGDTLWDTVYYSIHGPVEYPLMEDRQSYSSQVISMKWTGHDSTNELKAIYLMNKAHDPHSFQQAIWHFQCPAQNIVYGDIEGNIAGFAQGKWVRRQENQGRFLLSGKDPRTLWTQYVPPKHAPSILNPSQGFLQAANQVTTGPGFPYWYQGSFSDFRSWRIQEILESKNDFRLEHMTAIQLDVHSKLAEKALPIMLSMISKIENLNPRERLAIQNLSHWNYQMVVEKEEPSLFQYWWACWMAEIWNTELHGLAPAYWPRSGATLSWLEHNQIIWEDPTLSATASRWNQQLIQALRSALDSLDANHQGDFRWGTIGPGKLEHLSRIPALGIDGLTLGGSAETINAQKEGYGPGWRMVVELTNPLKAKGVYAGGQSGNPGSPYYDAFVDTWAKGAYFDLIFLAQDSTLSQSDLHHSWTFIPQ